MYSCPTCPFVSFYIYWPLLYVSHFQLWQWHGSWFLSTKEVKRTAQSLTHWIGLMILPEIGMWKLQCLIAGIVLTSALNYGCISIHINDWVLSLFWKVNFLCQRWPLSFLLRSVHILTLWLSKISSFSLSHGKLKLRRPLFQDREQFCTIWSWK